MSVYQLDLQYDGRSAWDGAGVRLLRLIEAVVDLRGVKQVAFDLDLRASDVVNAVKRRDRHYFRIEHLPYFVMHAPDHAIVEFLASLRGLDVAERTPPKPEEELAAYRAAIKETLGPDLQALLEAKARRKPR